MSFAKGEGVAGLGGRVQGLGFRSVMYALPTVYVIELSFSMPALLT